MRFNRILGVTLGLLFILALGAAGYSFYSAKAMLDDLFAAANASPVGKLNPYFDWNKMKAQFAAESKTYFSANIDTLIVPGKPQPGLEFARLIAMKSIQPSVDQLASPEGFGAILTGLKVRGGNALGTLVYRLDQVGGLNELRASFYRTSAPENTGTLTVHRQGASWIIDAIVLPPGTLVGPVDPSGGAVDDSVEAFATRHGQMTVTDPCAHSTDSAPCKTLTLNGAKLFDDFNVEIVNVFPKVGPVSIAIVHNDGGGNCCAGDFNLIDAVTDTPFIERGLPSGNRELTKLTMITPNVFILQTLAETDKFGDPVYIDYLYYRAKHLVIRTPFNGKTDFSEYIDKYPYDYLNDVDARKPLLDLLGNGFKDFRDHVALSSPMKFVGNKFLIGSGCVAHDCGDSGGIFILDIAHGTASAIMINDHRAKLFGPTPDQDVVKPVVEEWLNSFGLSYKN
jgi:hypothetical protein